jgi:predicted nucleic acid-binding protein
VVEVVVCRHVKEAGRGVRDHKLSYYDAQVWATARLNQVPVAFGEDSRSMPIFESILPTHFHDKPKFILAFYVLICYKNP